MDSQRSTHSSRVWLEGYGSVFVPRTPCEMARFADPAAVIIGHRSDAGFQSMRVVADEAAANKAEAIATQVALSGGVKSPAVILEFIEENDTWKDWTIVTKELAAPCPVSVTIWSTQDGTDWPFELTRIAAEMPEGYVLDDELAYVQGPFPSDGLPELSMFAADGMTEKDRGQREGLRGTVDWIDLSYEFEGERWLQRRQIVNLSDGAVALVTSQSKAAVTAWITGIANQLADGVKFREELA